ncbi:hypothetical protein EYF80_021705 [Liparis tanakae]|uniref:Uncharacterized protein n=1 Tax=Liparis tanakae TaxID=230148 RepID=A0A4Z2HQZ8_9TELE|nr:hypothetical protein EYF80_021705 [Liparis tanakae]
MEADSPPGTMLTLHLQDWTSQSHTALHLRCRLPNLKNNSEGFLRCVCEIEPDGRHLATSVEEERRKPSTFLTAAEFLLQLHALLLQTSQFSAASVFPAVVPALLSSPFRGTFALTRTLEGSAGFRLPTEAAASGSAAWKNLCRAVCVLWAEAVQDWAGFGGATGFRSVFRGADSTEEGRGGAGWVGPAPLKHTAEPAGPFLTADSEEDGLQLFWWALQMKVSGFFPGL